MRKSNNNEYMTRDKMRDSQIALVRLDSVYRMNYSFFPSPIPQFLEWNAMLQCHIHSCFLAEDLNISSTNPATIKMV